MSRRKGYTDDYYQFPNSTSTTEAEAREQIELRLRDEFDRDLSSKIDQEIAAERTHWEEKRAEQLEEEGLDEEEIKDQLDDECDDWEQEYAAELREEMLDEFEGELEDLIERELDGMEELAAA
jgi:fused signal recognition particle receptor